MGVVWVTYRGWDYLDPALRTSPGGPRSPVRGAEQTTDNGW